MYKRVVSFKQIIFSRSIETKHELKLTITFSEWWKYIIVLNSSFTLNHKGKNVLNQPSNLQFRSNVVLYYCEFRRFFVLHTRCIVFHFSTRSHWPVILMYIGLWFYVHFSKMACILCFNDPDVQVRIGELTTRNL